MSKNGHGYNLRDRKILDAVRKAKLDEQSRILEAQREKKSAKRSKAQAMSSSSSSSSDDESDDNNDVRARGRAKAPKPKKVKRHSPDPDCPPLRPRHPGAVYHSDASFDSDSETGTSISGSSSDDGSSSSQDELEDGEHIPTHDMDELQGIDDIKGKIMQKIVYPFSAPKKASLIKKDPPKGLLLTGVPGTGKSVLADAIVNEIRKSGVHVKYYKETGGCLSKYVGEAERKIRELFAQAKRTAPSVIFFDEIDGIGAKRKCGSSGGNNTLLTTLLNEINEAPRGTVLLIAATNCPDHCDNALIRKGRMDLTINIPIPDAATREKIIEHYFSKKNIDLEDYEMKELVEQTQGYAGSDLKGAVEDVYDNILEVVFPDGCWRNMTKKEIKAKMVDFCDNIDFEDDVIPVIEELNNSRQAMKSNVVEE